MAAHLTLSVLLPKRQQDLPSPIVVRITQGQVSHLPFRQTPPHLDPVAAYSHLLLRQSYLFWDTVSGQVDRVGAEGRYGLSSFVIDWEQENVTCPQGETNLGWYPIQNPYGEPLIVAQWATAVCRACSSRAQCVRHPKTPRSIRFHPKERYLALQKARERQTTDEFKKTYAQRAGVEGTIS
jgi:hypothetical protein